MNTMEVGGFRKLLLRFLVFMVLLGWPFHTFPSDFYRHLFHVKKAIISLTAAGSMLVLPGVN